MTDNHKNVDSVRRRFLVTLLVNAVKSAVGLVTASMVPRALGPRDYGNFQFITSTSTSLRGFLDMSASTAMYTYNSRNRQSGLALYLYIGWLLLQFGVILIVISLSSLFHLESFIWPQQELGYIYFIAALEWFNFVSMFFIQLGESKAETVLVQKVNFLAQTARLLLLAGLYFLSLLTLDTFIVVSYVSSVFTIAVILFTFLIKKRKEYFSFVYSYIDAKGIVKYLVRYCIPLIVLTLVIFGHDFFDRWFLQTVAGSVEQAYFSLAFQWSAISLLFTTSMLNIFWREIAVSFGENDFDRMRTMFLKASKALYFLSSAIAFFVAFNAEGLLSHLVGDKYLHAKVVIILLAFYPIHQTFGQINGAFYYATERVSLYRNLTIVGLIFGVATSYFLLAPNNAIIPGLQLGSLGLALKMLIVNIITVNLILYYNTRFLGLFFGRVLVDQIISVIVVGICSGAAFLIIQQIGLHDFWFQLGGMGILQVSFLFGVAYVFPQVTGLTRMEIRHYGQLVKDRVW